MRWLPAPALVAALVLVAGARPARAEIAARALLEALAAPRELGTGAARPRTGDPFVLRDGRLPVLVRAGSAAALSAAGFRELAPGVAVANLTPEEVRAASARPGWSLTWSPPLRPTLDRAAEWIELDRPAATEGTTGRGVLLGIIDTGIDPGHGDLRDREGRLRTEFYVDFASDGGAQPALEAEYCTAGGGHCAIYALTDLDARYTNDRAGDEPTDPFGHGTHVASLAAGSGFSTPDHRYVGVAPDARLIAVRVTGPDGSIAETDVLRAVRFVFEQAAGLGLPAVVNLSLGTDFGAHDGSSPLELALASLVGPDHPGRALVVAAGNGGTTFEDPASPYPGPFGIHTEVRLPEGTEARVPLLTPSLLPTVSGSLFAWIGFNPGDDVAVGLDDRHGEWIAPVAPGRSETWVTDELEITIVNEPVTRDDVEVSAHAAALIVRGSWPSDTVFALRLVGRGTARLWVQGEGAVLAGTGFGGLFAGASARATVNLPATHPDLIAVGATVNRSAWPTVSGPAVSFTDPLGIVAPFSAAGPTTTGLLKPDLVAPGDFVVGAMATAADPRQNGGAGLFAGASHCAVEGCHVVDAAHGVASGTSMAAPLVAGAAALLLERDPALDQRAIRGLLQAGATVLDAAAGGALAGAGLLDVRRSLAALAAPPDRAPEPSGPACRLILADAFARPGGEERLEGLLQLRAEDGEIADGARPPRLSLAVHPGRLLEPLTRRAPGSYGFTVAALAGTGGQVLTVRAKLDGEELVSVSLPIAVDRHLSTRSATAHGGCAVVAPSGECGGFGVGWGAGLVAIAAFARRRVRTA